MPLMKRLISLTALTFALGCGAADAQYTDGTIKIGVMNDMSGTYSDLSGQGSVVAARMAVEDFGAARKGMKVEIVRDKNKVFLVSGAGASDLTGPACTANTIHWTYDTWALANGTGSAIVKTGGDTWYFITADYAFGHALERDVEAVVLKNGGKGVGEGGHPPNT